MADLAVRVARPNDAGVDTVVLDALAAIAHSCGADRAYVIVLHDDDTFEISHEWTAPGVPAHEPALARMTATDFPFSYRAARRGEVFGAADVTALPPEADPERNSFDAFGVRSVLQIPVLVGGETCGVIGVNHHHSAVDGWPDDLVETVTAIGSVLAGVLLRRRASESLRLASDEVATVSRQRDDLLAHASHELRTPLHAILGYADLLALETTSPRSLDAVHEIVRNGRHLLGLIEELLAGGDTPGPDDTVAVRPEVDAAIAALRDSAAVRGITIAPSDRTLGAIVHATPGRLRQVLYCVFTSAVNAVADDSVIEVDTPEETIIRTRLGRPRPGVAAVNPLARVLISGHGRLDSWTNDDGSVIVDVVFDRDQTAKP